MRRANGGRGLRDLIQGTDLQGHQTTGDKSMTISINLITIPSLLFNICHLPRPLQASADNEYGWADVDEAKLAKEEKPHRKDSYKEDRKDNQVSPLMSETLPLITTNFPYGYFHQSYSSLITHFVCIYFFKKF